ncbi:MAG: zinc-ribbon domain-containing protein [Nitrospirota bacterium]
MNEKIEMTCIHSKITNEIFCSQCGVILKDIPIEIKSRTGAEIYNQGLIYLANGQFDEALIRFKTSASYPSLKIQSLQMVIYTLFSKGLDDFLKPQFLYQCEKLKEAYSQDGKEEKEIREIMASVYSCQQWEKIINGQIPLSNFFEKCNQQLKDISVRKGKFIFCNHCGLENQVENNFCPNCGIILNLSKIKESHLESKITPVSEISSPFPDNRLDVGKVANQWSKVAIIGCVIILIFIPVSYYLFDSKWQAYCFNRVGEKALKLGLYPQANTAFEQAVSLNPTSIRYNSNLAFVLFKSGKSVETLRQFKKVFSLAPRNKEVRKQINMFLQENKELVEDWYQQAHKLFNSNKFIQSQHLLEEGKFLGYTHPEADKLLASLQKRKVLCLSHCAKAKGRLAINEIDSAKYHLKQALYFYPDANEIKAIQSEIKNNSTCQATIGVFGVLETKMKDSRQIVKVIQMSSPEIMCEIMEGARDYPDYDRNKLACWIKELKKREYHYKEKELNTAIVVTIFNR